MKLWDAETFAEPGIYSPLKDRAERKPESTAVIAPGRGPMSFSRFIAYVEETLEILNGMGVGRNDRVAIVLPNGAEMAVAVLSVTSACTCVPLNPACRPDEFDFYFSELEPKALVVQAGMKTSARAVAASRAVPIIELSPEARGAAGALSLAGRKQGHAAHGGPAQAQDIALILYTSGTTSRPKMVPLTHSNILASAKNIAASLQLSENDRCLNVMPLFHIHGLVGALIAPLMAGGSVVCPPAFDAEKFSSWMEEFRPTWYTAVPAMHQAVLSSVDAHRGKIARCSLRFIRSSSAALPLRVKEGLEEAFGVPVIEAYGMTEAAHQISGNPLPPGERKAGSVGVPVGVDVAVMSQGGDLVPRGSVGEIVIRGGNVMGGYANNPQANEESFRGGWLRTGDQGYLDEDGYLFLTGRLKEMINRGGEKISPWEVDEALLQHPAVLETASFALPHPTLGEDVAAAVVVHQNAPVTEAELREFMLARLAPHKVPHKVLFVDALPKGPTAKVERAGLAKKFAVEPRREWLAPRNALEAIVASIYADVLRVDRVGVWDNFFDLGGDSLRATQVISRVRAILQINLPIATVFRKATVAEIAEEIASAMNGKEPRLLARILKEVENASKKYGVPLGGKAGRRSRSGPRIDE